VNLVKNCLDHIIGEPGKSGHYFTIWGFRQTGKTWLMRQVKQQIENDYPDGNRQFKRLTITGEPP